MKTKHSTLYSEHTEHVSRNYITGNWGDGSITTDHEFRAWDSSQPSNLTIKLYIFNHKVIGVCSLRKAEQDRSQ